MKLFLKTKDFSVSGEQFELHWDEELDMLVTQPQPENLTPYYESEDYISHTDSKSSFTDRLYQSVKAKNLKNKIQIVENQLDETKNLLDLGAGTGDFLIAAQNSDFQVTGVEPNHKARKLAEQKGIRLSSNVEDVAGQKFQAITLWHVLEHLPNLKEQIETWFNFWKRTVFWSLLSPTLNPMMLNTIHPIGRLLTFQDTFGIFQKHRFPNFLPHIKWKWYKSNRCGSMLFMYQCFQKSIEETNCT